MEWKWNTILEMDLLNSTPSTASSAIVNWKKLQVVKGEKLQESRNQSSKLIKANIVQTNGSEKQQVLSLTQRELLWISQMMSIRRSGSLNAESQNRIIVVTYDDLFDGKMMLNCTAENNRVFGCMLNLNEQQIFQDVAPFVVDVMRAHKFHRKDVLKDIVLETYAVSLTDTIKKRSHEDYMPCNYGVGKENVLPANNSSFHASNLEEFFESSFYRNCVADEERDRNYSYDLRKVLTLYDFDERANTEASSIIIPFYKNSHEMKAMIKGILDRKFTPKIKAGLTFVRNNISETENDGPAKKKIKLIE